MEAAAWGDGVVGAGADGAAVPPGRRPAVRPPVGHQGFFSYYRLGGADEPNAPEDEPRKEGELTRAWEPSHSPFGFVWQIANATGWSVKYILEGVNFQTLIMMLADAPRYIRKKKEEKSAEDEANEIVGFFQSNLKK